MNTCRQPVSLVFLALLFAVALCASCGKKEESDAEPKMQNGSAGSSQPTGKKDKLKAPARGPNEPDRVTLKLLVLPCEGGRLGLVEPRPTSFEARALAASLKTSLETSDDVSAEFDTLALQYSADPDVKTSKGIRTLTNWGVEPDTDNHERARAAMPAIADQAFKMPVGSIAIIDLDEKMNPLGIVLVFRSK
ncbi:MAG: hypothetical protein V3W41_17680 [Planctomycetota bacterium]